MGRHDMNSDLLYVGHDSDSHVDSSEDIGQEDVNNMAMEMLASFGTTLDEIVRCDKSDIRKGFEILADHYLDEIKAIANTKYKSGNSHHVNEVKLEKSRKRLYEMLGYPDNYDGS